MKTKAFLSIIFCFFPVFAFAQDIFRGAGIGFIISDLQTGETVFEQNSNLCLAPASVSKIITTATAVEILGADFRFQTTLKYDGEINGGVLNGNLYLCGGGDATLGSSFFPDYDFLTEFYKALKKKGIAEINGYVIPNAEIFDNEAIPFGWMWQDIANYYGSGVYGLSVWDNTVSVTFRTGKQGETPQIVDVSPKIDGLTFENYLVAKKNCGDSAYFYGAPYDNKRLIFGTLEVNHKHFTVKADIPNPPMAAAQALNNFLNEKRIKTLGIMAENSLKNLPKKTLHIYFSPPLSEIIKTTNYLSNNSFAEHLLKFLSVNSNQKGTLAKSLEIVKNFWAGKGLDVSAFFITDGSGLSPHSAISAKFINNVLVYMARESKNSQIFINSLPIAGKDGTVKNFLKNTPLQGKARLKSGSIERVQCYAGYIVDNERNYAITILVNNFSGKRKDAVKEIEKMILEHFWHTDNTDFFNF
ncbi:MAG: D-alanyl-D-alanine carboxypeptidase/D-alanyl-D-alanine-endopeptidase [Prevotellaceae bacterium]|jgi:D-alanyl-D-alanine carboxypeptidase/D-alanyl-D-alanine-endopeptidase (penicillin-binding protein 4)|nr:D-alanyl-D-alanine carboxypeptidase/D-alanyl-D-alanine-endopeptidase [Prevotellaceae bacterium]